MTIWRRQCIDFTVRYMYEKKEIKVVAFDLDNTLYDQDEYYKQVIAEFAIDRNLVYEELLEIFCKIKESSRDIFGDILSEYGIFTSELQEAIFEKYNKIDAKIKLFDNAVEAIKFLTEKKIKIAIITNGVITAQQNKIRCLGIENMFNIIIYARTWGKEFEKPHERSFSYLLEWCNCSAREVIFLGDSLETDIRGAEQLGIHAIHINKQANLTSLLKKYIYNETRT